jgi:beta-glucosidase
MLKRYSHDLPGMPLIVTENGAAFHDVVYNQQVQDTDRSEYIKQSIIRIKRAEAEGIQVKGYFVWSFTDNFEWAEGYHPRFGLVYVDFTNQVRIVKSSGRQYGEFIKNQIINP